ALADHVVDVHQPVPRDGVGDDAHVEDVAEAADRVDVDPIDGQQVGEGEGRLHEGGKEPELRLDALTWRDGDTVDPRDALDGEGQVDDEERDHHRVEVRRLDVPAPGVGCDPAHQIAVEVGDGEHGTGRVRRRQQTRPDAAVRLREQQRGVEEDRGGETDAGAEDAAPPLRLHPAAEVVEGEEVEVPADDGQGQGGEHPVQPPAGLLPQHEGTDDEVRRGRTERYEP